MKILDRPVRYAVLGMMEILRIGGIFVSLIGLAMLFGTILGKSDLLVRDYAGIMALGIALFLYGGYGIENIRKEIENEKERRC